jgi:hypothetical protein
MRAAKAGVNSVCEGSVSCAMCVCAPYLSPPWNRVLCVAMLPQVHMCRTRYDHEMCAQGLLHLERKGNVINTGGDFYKYTIVTLSQAHKKPSQSKRCTEIGTGLPYTY